MSSASSPANTSDSGRSFSLHPKILAGRAFQILAVEFVFTFFLAFIRIMIGNIPSKVFGMGLAAAVFTHLGGHISGGHYNPAITIAHWIRGKMSTTVAVCYMLMQVLGAIFGALFAYAVFAHFPFATDMGYAHFTMAPQPQVNIMQLLVVELVFISFMCFFHLVLTTSFASRDNEHYSLTWGFMVAAATSTASSISGGLLNPAIAIGGACVASLHFGAAATVSLWAHLVAGILGGVFGGLFFKYVSRVDVESPERGLIGRNKNLGHRE